MDEPVTGSGSGGPLAHVTWWRGRQYIETHVRGALGIVKYGCGDLRFLHQEYLRWRGVHGAYPGFSDDPLDGFRHLRDDLLGPAADVLTLTDEDFSRVAAGVAAMSPPRLP
jgi:hypothetical protein